ncbi:hypothetical protein VSS37_02700 [Candidatus Thiothrix sp. Deng01]|uniref:Uncharacterized protein n=1 Tax=Candidatus Thiothrix phosphatis TaxID=3112415 RepID=A0ABU6CUY2_9GAMM|nr:hypothetical protein [Candidatus Thiothrix sp. Deng01]MEB4589878.1 hypothetical protein [Candidatus Thiothrix sp. Deng01]
MLELTLYEHFILNCLVRNRAHFYYDSIDYKNAPDINTLKDLYLEHFQGLLGQPVKTVKSSTADVIENRSNTIIDKLLGNDANSYKTSKHRKANYQVIDVG